MKITKVQVTYGELRSTGYPSFSNKRHEITLEAKLEEGETARHVKDELNKIAKREVQILFGDILKDNADQLDIPF